MRRVTEMCRLVHDAVDKEQEGFLIYHNSTGHRGTGKRNLRDETTFLLYYIQVKK
jgi:hypothetical protein